MAAPIKICRFMKAMTDTEEFDSLVRDMAFNLKQKHYAIVPCDHSPPCRTLSPEEAAMMKKRVSEAVDAKYKDPNARWLY